MIIILTIAVFFQEVSCQCPGGQIGTNNETNFGASRAKRLYLNTAAPAPCSGTITEGRICYYKPSNLNTGKTYSAIVAVYRLTNLRDSSVQYNRISDVFNINLTGAEISATSGNFICTTLDHPDFDVEAGDVVGACIFDPSGGTKQLDLVGNTNDYSLMEMSSSGCSPTDIPSPVLSSQLSVISGKILHIYANITSMSKVDLIIN